MAGFSLYRVWDVRRASPETWRLRIQRIEWTRVPKAVRIRQPLLTTHTGLGTLLDVWPSLPDADGLFVHDEEG